jgi:hypothetical protein
MIFEASLIGLLCYLGALSSPWLLGLTGGWYLISRPLISGMLVGLILGDVKTGIMIGVAVQAVYIAMVTPGGSMPADLNFVVKRCCGWSPRVRCTQRRRRRFWCLKCRACAPWKSVCSKGCQT